VPERSAHDVALPILLAIGITWYGFEYQPRQGIEKFDVDVRLKPLRVLSLQLLELLNQTIVKVQIPLVFWLEGVLGG
jgi:hypothetical protein